MADYLKCFPNFDSMDFYEFLIKYDKIKNRIKDSSKNGVNAVSFLKQFENFINGR